jgi:hypothetical protein
LRYQRQIIAYHGCLVERFDDALLRGIDPPLSTEPFDWLGNGVYFWEHGPDRAYQWALDKARRAGRPREDARVLGAIIQLGECLDLLDTAATALLADAWKAVDEFAQAAGKVLPVNRAPQPNDHDLLLRHLDCLVINTATRMLEQSDQPVQTVRGCFLEGESAFPGAQIRQKSHIQVAVRDMSCIVGYFNPRSMEPS